MTCECSSPVCVSACVSPPHKSLSLRLCQARPAPQTLWRWRRWRIAPPSWPGAAAETTAAPSSITSSRPGPPSPWAGRRWTQVGGAHGRIFFSYCWCWRSDEAPTALTLHLSPQTKTVLTCFSQISCRPFSGFKLYRHLKNSQFQKDQYYPAYCSCRTSRSSESAGIPSGRVQRIVTLLLFYCVFYYFSLTHRFPIYAYPYPSVWHFWNNTF